MWLLLIVLDLVAVVVAVAVGCDVSRPVIHPLTCNLMTCVLNWCQGILNV